MQLKTKPILFAILIIFGIAIAAFVFTSNFRYTSPTAVKNYISTHNTDTAIYCIDPVQTDNHYIHQADELFPLAGSIKILLLAVYAKESADGTINPDELIAISDIDRYYLPGTDGGAHEAFIKSVKDNLGKITIDQIVTGMTTYGSNAAFDYILSRLDKTDFENLKQNINLTYSYQPQSFLGLYLFMNNHETGLYADEVLTIDEIRKEEARLVDLYLFNSEWRQSEAKYQEKYVNLAPTYIQKEVVGNIGDKGSVSDMIRLMMAAYGYRPGFSAAEQSVMQKHLEWPMQINPENTKKFSSLGSVNGVWPAVFTSIWYAKTNDNKTIFLGVFYKNVPDDFWNTWLTTFTHQQFDTQILSTGDCLQFPATR